VLIFDPLEGGGTAIDLIGGALSFGLGLIGSLLGSLFGNLFGGGDVNKLANAVNQLATNVAKSLDLLKRFAWTIGRALGALLAAVHDWFVLFLGRVWAMIQDIAKAIGNLAKQILPDLAKAVRVARKVLDDIYRNYIRPVLNWIQIARRYLAILRALHVPFAGQLDAILVKIEGKIIAPYLYALRTLNGIGSWVNVIVTAGGVIQRPLFLRTMYAYQQDWINMWWVGQLAPPGAAGALTPEPPAVPQTASQVMSDFAVYAQTGAGPFEPYAAQAADGFNQAIAG